MRISKIQLELLKRLPDSPSDGMLCKAGKRATADSLVRHGLAKMVGLNQDGFGWFVRTNAGRAWALDG